MCKCTHVHMSACLSTYAHYVGLYTCVHLCLLSMPLSIQSQRWWISFFALCSCNHTHVVCYLKALFQKWWLCSSFSAREIKNRNIYDLWMYFPSRKSATVGVRHWLNITTWCCLPMPPLAGTCGALWSKAFLTGPRSPEELLETERRTTSVEPG